MPWFQGNNNITSLVHHASYTNSGESQAGRNFYREHTFHPSRHVQINISVAPTAPIGWYKYPARLSSGEGGNIVVFALLDGGIIAEVVDEVGDDVGGDVGEDVGEGVGMGVGEDVGGCVDVVTTSSKTNEGDPACILTRMGY